MVRSVAEVGKDIFDEIAQGIIRMLAHLTAVEDSFDCAQIQTRPILPKVAPTPVLYLISIRSIDYGQPHLATWLSPAGLARKLPPA